MKKLYCIATLFLVTFFFTVNLYAAGGAPWTLTPSSTYPPTVHVPKNSAAIVQYTITNQSPRSRALAITPISGVTSISGDGLCGSSFTLPKKGSSCILSLQISGQQAQDHVNAVVEACETGNQCYGTKPSDNLDITVTSDTTDKPSTPSPLDKPSTPSPSDSVVSTPTPTSTVLYSSLNPVATGSQMTLSAAITSSGGVPTTGSVSFTRNAATISGCDALPITASGIVTCTPPEPTTTDSVDTIVATYTAGDHFLNSASAPLKQYATSSQGDATPPSTPRNINVQPSNGEVTVSWTPPVNTGGVAIKNYMVNYGETSTNNYSTMGCTSSDATPFSCVVPNLTNGTSYTFTVTATNAREVSGLIAFSSPTTPNNEALSIRPSILALSGQGGGATRTATVTNHSSSDITINTVNLPTDLPGDASITPLSTACLSGMTLAANGGQCTITVNPGNSPTSSSSCATTSSEITPTPSTVTVGDNTHSVTGNVVILGYGCQYQGGHLFSIDDTTPNTQSIGGKVAALSSASPMQWSVSGDQRASEDLLPGIGDSSTALTVSPTYDAFSDFFKKTYDKKIPTPGSALFGACDGSYDGYCNTHNIVNFYNAYQTHYGSTWFALPVPTTGPTPLTSYAAGWCSQYAVDASGNASFSGNTGWYLPAICELGSQSKASCAKGTSDIASIPSWIDSNLRGSYWSSTEVMATTVRSSPAPQDNVWYQTLAQDGNSNAYQKKDKTASLVCVKALA